MVWYILDADGQPHPTQDANAHSVWFATSNRTLAVTKLEPHGTVSTVFLSIDHNFSGLGPPVLWETMVFGGVYGEYQTRYSSKDDALLGHAAIVERIHRRVAAGPVDGLVRGPDVLVHVIRGNSTACGLDWFESQWHDAPTPVVLVGWNVVTGVATVTCLQCANQEIV